MSIRNKLISNTTYLFLNWAVLTLMGFLYWFIAGKTLLPTEYGMVSTSLNLAILLAGITSLGLTTAVGKLIPEYQAKKQTEKINSLVRFSLKAVFVSNVIFLLIIFSLSSFLSNILNIPSNIIWISGIILLIYSISLQLTFIIFGFQNMKKLATTEFFGQLTKVIISITLIFLGFKHFGPLIGFLIGIFLTGLLRFFSISFKGKTKKINQKKIMFNYAIPALVAGLAWVFLFNGQYVLLTAIKGPEATGIFSIAMLLTSPLAIIPSILTAALLPTTSQLSVYRGTIKKRSYLIELVFRYALFISLPLAIFLILFSKPIILLFSRIEYISASRLIPLLVFGSIIYGSGNGFLASLYAMGKTKINRNIVVATTLMFLLFAFPLVYLFSSFGSVLAYTLSVTFLALISFFYLKKFLKFQLPFKTIVRLFIACLISFGFLYIIVSLIPNMFIQIGFIFITALIYLMTLIPLKFYTIEDIKILDFFAEKSPFFKVQIAKVRNYLSKFV